MEIVGLLLWVVMGCAVPAGSEEVYCPVSTALTDGPGDLVPKRSLLCRHSGLPAGSGGPFPNGETEAWGS